MKLLYVWIQKFDNIEDLEFNFSSDYKLNYSFEENRLNIEKAKQFAPNLFGDNISDLKVIVGANGAGKSTLLEFITTWIGNYHLPAIVAFDKTILISDGLREGFKITGETLEKVYFGIKSNMSDDEKPYKSTGLIYYSSFYDRRRDRHSHYSLNISTNHLIINDKLSYRKNSTKITEIHSNKISDVKRQINFIESNIIPELPFDYPEYVGVYFKNQFNDTREELAWAEIKKTVYGRIITGIHNNISAQYRNNFGYLEESNYPLFVFLIKGVLLEKYIFSRIVEKSTEIVNEINVNSDFLGLFKMSPQTEKATLINLMDFHDEMLKILIERDSQNKLLININEFFKFINEVLKDTDITMRISLGRAHVRPQEFAMHTMEFSIKCRVFFQFVDLYEKTLDYEEYLDFTPQNLSSGEFSFINLFSRLYSVRDHEKIKNKSDVLIMLDEAEVGFHPQWQKQLFKYLLKYLPKIFEGKRLQIIIATNSPFILSDIPKTSVIFLEKYKDQSTSKTLSRTRVLNEDEVRDKKTFGANIYELLADSFFLQNGYIGEFADEKIMDTLQWLKDENSMDNIEYYKYIIELVGEPFVKEKLRELYINKIGYWNDSDL